jgi:hypothetical protein
MKTMSIQGGTPARQTPEMRVGRSQFDLSYTRKMTFDASYLYPLMAKEVYPGDTFTVRADGIIRVFSPLKSPILDNVEVETLWFYVPTRLVWTNFQAFMGEHDDAGAQDVDYTVPRLADGTTVDHGAGVGIANCMAYFGIPHGLQTAQVNINALPFRAYYLIYSEWFRDQGLIGKPTLDKSDGPDSTTYWIRRTAKKHDYFTTCLPYLQKGDPVTLTWDGNAPVITGSGIGSTISIYSTDAADDQLIDTNLAQADVSSSTGSLDSQKLMADLTSSLAPGITVNSLRYSLAIQRFLERDARAGTRYVEIVQHRFGVTVPDYRVQRPEFLGSGKSFINVSPVANTVDQAAANSAGGSDVYQGELRGVGTGRITGGFAKSFPEHGYIIGLIRARGDLTYFQGLRRMWSRRTLYDFYAPEFAGLGEMSVLNKEIYVSNSSATDDDVFGYQQPWEDLRRSLSEIVGKLNPDVSGALSQWHVAEDFGSLPTLSQTFIEDQTPMSRVQAVTTEPDFLADIRFTIKAARPIPVFSVPSIMGARF